MSARLLQNDKYKNKEMMEKSQGSPDARWYEGDARGDGFTSFHSGFLLKYAHALYLFINPVLSDFSREDFPKEILI